MANNPSDTELISRVANGDQNALAELPDDQRQAFLLRAEQGLGVEEIAEVMGVGRETAKSRLRYALEKLRARLR